MKVNIYAVISRSVLDGIHQGISEANRHAENPVKIDERTRESMHSEIMRELTEYIDWEDSDK